MTKQELITKIADVLKNNNVTKPISVPNSYFYVCDDSDNKKKFTVNFADKDVFYTKKDVSRIIEALIAVMEDAMQRGESISFYGMFTIGVRKRAARMVKIPLTDTFKHIPEHYTPFIEFGNTLKRAAKVFDLKIRSGDVELPDPIYDACESEFEDEEIDYE